MQLCALSSTFNLNAASVNLFRLPIFSQKKWSQNQPQNLSEILLNFTAASDDILINTKSVFGSLLCTLKN